MALGGCGHRPRGRLPASAGQLGGRPWALPELWLRRLFLAKYGSRVPFDALVVLGCRVHGGRLSHAALRRVEQAAHTYRDAGARLVIASGGQAWQGWLEAEVFARGLVERGVPRERLLEERDSLTTRGNAQGVARLLQGRNVRSLGVVTCDWHIPRAMRLFRRAGFGPTAVPATTPPRPRHLVWARGAREHASTVVDTLLAIARTTR